MNPDIRKRFHSFVIATLTVVFIPWLGTGCRGSEEQLDQLLASSYSRLTAAIEKREEERADTLNLEATQAAFSQLVDAGHRIAGADGSEPPTAAPVERSTAKPATPAVDLLSLEGRNARAALADLVKMREEFALRGAVSSYRAEAEAAWELETWRGIVARTGGRDDFPPANDLRLLPTDKLNDLIARWTTKKQTLREMAAVAPYGLGQGAIDECEAKLRALQEAREQPVQGPPRLRRPRDALEEVRRWLAERDATREAAIHRAEARLLKAAVSRNPGNVAAEARLAELETSSYTRLDALRITHRKIARDLAYALSPRPGPLPAQAEQLVRALVFDPIAAAQNEAFLDLAWTNLRQIGDDAVRDHVLPPRLRASREDWIVSNLADLELQQARLLLQETQRRLRIVDAQWPALVTADQLPRERIKRYAGSIERELAFRANPVKARPSTTAAVQHEVIDRLSRWRIADVLATEEGKVREWQALQRFAAAGADGSEIQARLGTLSLSGFGREVDILEKEAAKLLQFRVDLTKNGLTIVDGVNSDLRTAAQTLRAKLVRLRRGTESTKAAAEKVAGLKKRLAAVQLVIGPGSNDASPAGPRDPVSPIVPGSGPASAYLDPELRQASHEFAERLAQAKARTPREEVALVQHATYALEADPNLRISKAVRSRPKADGWRIDGKLVSFADINGLRSVDILPGGVALGAKANVNSQLQGHGLRYDINRQRLEFVHRDGVLQLPQIGPEALKACFLFARDADPVAVSIGYTGGDDRLFGRDARRVAIHPQLRDTRVGFDIIQADRLPWALEDPVLPNGRNNPFVITMKPFIERVRTETLAALPTARVLSELKHRKISLAESARDTWLPAVREMSNSGSTLDLLIYAVASASTVADRFEAFVVNEDEKLNAELRLEAKRKGYTDQIEIETVRLKALEQIRSQKEFRERREAIHNQLQALPDDPIRSLGFLGLLALQAESDHSWTEAARLVLIFAMLSKDSPDPKALAAEALLAIEARQLSLLTDHPTRWLRKGNGLEPSTALRIRYVGSRIEKTTDGFRRGTAAVNHHAASEAATLLLPRIEESYPAVRATREYAAWISLLRWALQPGNVAWLDLADLVEVEHRTVMTPDYLCQSGTSHECAEAIAAESE